MMRARLALLLVAVLMLALHSDAQPAKIRGAALGGWLLLEKFIATTVMGDDPRIVDEWTFGLYASETQRLMLQDHWANFYQEADFQRMREAGLTHVRVAIGYWHMCTQAELDAYLEPYITGGWETGLVPTVARMKRQGMRAILDLHAVPGSQNGFDNSGRAGAIGWGQGDTMNRTFEILERLAQRILALENDPATSGVVMGIEPINEAACWNGDGPLPGGVDFLKQFYIDAYRLLRPYLPASKYMFVVEHAFLYDQWIGFMPTPEYENVWMDAHVYQAFSPSLYNASYSTHYSVSCYYQKPQLAKFTLPTLVGEWSLAYKQGSWDAELEAYPTASQSLFLRRWFTIQADIYENTNNAQGWFFWTWKTVSAPYWDYAAGLAGGWIPTVVNDSVAVNGGCSPPAPSPPPATLPPSSTPSSPQWSPPPPGTSVGNPSTFSTRATTGVSPVTSGLPPATSGLPVVSSGVIGAPLALAVALIALITLTC